MTAPLEDADVETAAAGYAARFDSPVGRFMLARQMNATLELLPGRARLRILDVGGGHGQVAPELARRGHQVTVFASSGTAVAKTLEEPIREGLVGLAVGNLREPDFDPLSFDVTLAYRLLAHAHDLEGLVRGLSKTARECVIVDYATSRSFNAVAGPLFEAKRSVEKNTRPFAVLGDSDVSSLFEANGFRAAGRKPQFFWPMALHRALGSVGISRALERVAALSGLRVLFGSPVIARFNRV